MMVEKDEVIKKEIVDHLFWDSRIDSSNIKVQVSEGIVTLSGSLPSLAACNVAREDAFDVSGVIHVIDNLEVKLPPDVFSIKDENLKKNIERALFLHPEVVSEHIEINVKDGIVTLKGSVPSYGEKEKAAQMASEISAVIDLKNKLSVVPTRRFLDEQVAKDIVAGLERDASIDAEKLDITVAGGTVTISGTVPDRNSFRKVNKIAAHTLGVIDVNNTLQVAANNLTVE